MANSSITPDRADVAAINFASALLALIQADRLAEEEATLDAAIDHREAAEAFFATPSPDLACLTTKMELADVNDVEQQACITADAIRLGTVPIARLSRTDLSILCLQHDCASESAETRIGGHNGEDAANISRLEAAIADQRADSADVLLWRARRLARAFLNQWDEPSVQELERQLERDVTALTETLRACRFQRP